MVNLKEHFFSIFWRFPLKTTTKPLKMKSTIWIEKTPYNHNPSPLKPSLDYRQSRGTCWEAGVKGGYYNNRNGPGKNRNGLLRNGPISIKISIRVYSTCWLEVVQVFICPIRLQIMLVTSKIVAVLAKRPGSETNINIDVTSIVYNQIEQINTCTTSNQQV